MVNVQIKSKNEEKQFLGKSEFRNKIDEVVGKGKEKSPEKNVGKEKSVSGIKVDQNISEIKNNFNKSM